MKKNLVRETVTKSKIITEDGVIKDESSKRRIVTTIKKEDFIQVFTRKISDWNRLSSSQHKILSSLWSRAEKDTNRVYLVKRVKEEISEETGISFGGVKNGISALTRKKLLISIGTGVYVLNPEYFFNGSEIKRAECLEFIFEFKFIESTKEQ